MPDPVSSSFCVLPWMHLFADENGTMFPCCRSVGSQLPNVHDGTDTPFRVQDKGGVEGGWNSAYMRQIRSQMLRGERPKPCERCYMYEDLGMRSHRQSQNEHHSELASGLVQRTSADGRVTLDLHSVDLRLGNLCNLQCRMCSPQSSKLLIREWAQIHDVPPTHEYFARLQQLDWFSRPEFWEVFEKHTANVERLHFAGGEPLLIDQMFEFLVRLVRSGRSRNVMLSYNTNLTVLPERVYDLWPHFRAVRVTVSVDGVGPVNEFIRYPSRWSKLAQNLFAIDRDAEKLNCTGGLGINCTVQVFNVARVTELLQYVADTFQNFEAPNLSILTYPEHLNIRLLPPQVKKVAADRIQAYLRELCASPPRRWPARQISELRAAAEGIVQHMMSEDHSDKTPEFRRWCNHQDRSRRQSVLDFCPELGPLFEGEDAARPELACAPQMQL